MNFKVRTLYHSECVLEEFDIQTLKMELVYTSETSVNTYQTLQRRDVGDHSLNFQISVYTWA
jgi:hypothetical protein